MKKWVMFCFLGVVVTVVGSLKGEEPKYRENPEMVHLYSEDGHFVREVAIPEFSEKISAIITPLTSGTVYYFPDGTKRHGFRIYKEGNVQFDPHH